MSNSLATLRQQIGRFLGAGDTAMFTGTPAATLSTTGFTCAALDQYENDYFNEWWLRVYSGTHKDTTRAITDFTQSGGTFVFSPAFSTAMVVADLFELHRDFSPEEINAAINMAILMVETEALADKVDETLAITASTWEYTLPTGFYIVSAVYQEESTSGKYAEADRIDPLSWKILSLSTGKKLWLDPDRTFLTTGRHLRLEGQALASQLTLDADTTDISPAYLGSQAIALLHLGRSGEVSKAHMSQAQLMQGLADRERVKLQVPRCGWLV